MCYNSTSGRTAEQRKIWRITMNKTELIAAVAEATKVSKKEAAAAYLRYLLAQKPKNRDLFPIPDLLDEVLEAQGSRYGLILFARGMTRDVKGYRKELARDVLVSVATAVLTLGTAVAIVTPNRYSSQIMAAVLDSETDRLVFFNTKNPQETDPLNLGPVHDQLSKLLKDFLK